MALDLVGLTLEVVYEDLSDVWPLIGQVSSFLIPSVCFKHQRHSTLFVRHVAKYALLHIYLFCWILPSTQWCDKGVVQGIDCNIFTFDCLLFSTTTLSVYPSTVTATQEIQNKIPLPELRIRNRFGTDVVIRDLPVRYVCHIKASPASE